MKRILCILLMLVLTLPALAEGAPLAEEAPQSEETLFAPFTLKVPQSVARVDNEGSATFVYGTSRVVVIRIERVPEPEPGEAIARLMAQYDPDAAIEEELPMAEGYTGLTACTADKFGEGVDSLTVMLLSPDGTLLILTGYDMTGSGEHAKALMDTLLSGMTVNGAPVVLRTE